MKNFVRVFGGILLIISTLLLSFNCDLLQKEQKYAIGDTGPAGGIIFFDKGEHNKHSVSYMGGNDNYSIDEGSDVGFSWRYMEVAPYGWFDGGDDPLIEWGGYGRPIGETLQGKGTGKENAEKITSVLGKGIYASKVCSEYSVTIDGVTYNDWFLPSWYTLQSIWWNLISDQSSSNFGRGARRADALGGLRSCQLLVVI